MTAHRYPEGIVSVGSACWCGSMQLSARVMSLEIDGTIHARGFCERLRPVPQVTL